MITSIRFKNYKALRDTTLPLGQFTLIVGPNGSGKSTALAAFEAVQNPKSQNLETVFNVHARQEGELEGSIRCFADGEQEQSVGWKCRLPDSSSLSRPASNDYVRDILSCINKTHIYRLSADRMRAPVALNPDHVLETDGYGLPGVLDHMQDQHPERFDRLNSELSSWLPEYDRVMFDVPQPGHKSIGLRTAVGKHNIFANDLSDGTMFTLAMLTLANLPSHPPLIGLEDPDHGIHPRLLRRVQDAIYRLVHPEKEDDREPIQVIATTHSPYFLDLFKDHPEQIVIADKTPEGVQFRSLAQQPHLKDDLGEAALGEVWYSGVLGGVPTES